MILCIELLHIGVPREDHLYLDVLAVLHIIPNLREHNDNEQEKCAPGDFGYHVCCSLVRLLSAKEVQLLIK